MAKDEYLAQVIEPGDRASALAGEVCSQSHGKVENAIHHALQILAGSNPAAYAAVRTLAEADTGEKIPEMGKHVR